MGWSDRLSGQGRASLIGLDISPANVKLVELDRDRQGRWMLLRLAGEPLDRGWVTEGQIDQLDEVAGAVRRAVARSGTRCRRVAMALPSSAVITRRIRAPSGLRDDEMLAQVELEMQPHIPFPLEDLSLDFCLLGSAPPRSTEVEVFVAASRRDRVEDRQALAEAAGLVAEVLDIEPYAAGRALARSLTEEAGIGAEALLALVTVGSDTTRLRVLRGEESLYDRDQAVGGAQLTQTIAQGLGIEFSQAERMKVTTDLTGTDLAPYVRPFVDTLAREVARALQYFFTSTPHHEVDLIALAGGGAGLPGLDRRVAALTGFETRVVDPFSGMAIGPAVPRERLAREAPGHLVACGLAMRGHLG
jgi:type IV pilus assembly protein PilM